MKKLLPFFSIVLLLAACSSEPTETKVQTMQTANVAADTAGLAQFQQWKTQNELNVADEIQPEEPVVTATPVKTVIREVRVERKAPVRKQSSTTTKKQTTPPQTNSGNNNTGTEDRAVSSESNTASAPSTEEAAKKEGWSKAAKGAAIGGAGGAVIGAVIYKKNPAVGAAIGGVLGGAVGYGIGRSKDKKDGRY